MKDKHNMDKCPICGNDTTITDNNDDTSYVCCTSCDFDGTLTFQQPLSQSYQYITDAEISEIAKYTAMMHENDNAVITFRAHAYTQMFIARLKFAVEKGIAILPVGGSRVRGFFSEMAERNV